MSTPIVWYENTESHREMLRSDPEWQDVICLYLAWEYPDDDARLVKIVRNFGDIPSVIGTAGHSCVAFAAVPIPPFPNMEIPE